METTQNSIINVNGKELNVKGLLDELKTDSDKTTYVQMPIRDYTDLIYKVRSLISMSRAAIDGAFIGGSNPFDAPAVLDALEMAESLLPLGAIELLTQIQAAGNSVN